MRKSTPFICSSSSSHPFSAGALTFPKGLDADFGVDDLHTLVHIYGKTVQI